MNGAWTAEYRSYRGMIQRCTYSKHNRWERYGGRGVRICKEWLNDFPAFLAYVCRKPTPQHSLDRYPNPDGNYEPGNVRWATPKEPRANRGLT